MTAEQVAPLIALGAFTQFIAAAISGVWHILANRRWSKALDERDLAPELAPGGVFHPGDASLSRLAAEGLPSAVRGLRKLRVPHPDPQVEYWRLRTARRAAISLGILGGGFILPIAGLVGALLGDRASDRLGTVGILLTGLFAGAMVVHLGRLGVILTRYGNGHDVSPQSIFRTAGSIVGTVAIGAIQVLILSL